MDKETLRKWLSSLNIPRIRDITELPMPNTFYVLFSETMDNSQESQLRLLGFSLTYDAGQHVRGRYLIRYNGDPVGPSEIIQE